MTGDGSGVTYIGVASCLIAGVDAGIVPTVGGGVSFG